MYNIEVLKRKNSRKYSPVLTFTNIDEVIAYVKEKALTVIGTPYIFTHIKMSDGSIITQTVMGMTCSPKTLLERLTK